MKVLFLLFLLIWVVWEELMLNGMHLSNTMPSYTETESAELSPQNTSNLDTVTITLVQLNI